MLIVNQHSHVYGITSEYHVITRKYIFDRCNGGLLPDWTLSSSQVKETLAPSSTCWDLGTRWNTGPVGSSSGTGSKCYFRHTVLPFYFVFVVAGSLTLCTTCTSSSPVLLLYTYRHIFAIKGHSCFGHNKVKMPRGTEAITTCSYNKKEIDDCYKTDLISISQLVFVEINKTRSMPLGCKLLI